MKEAPPLRRLVRETKYQVVRPGRPPSPKQWLLPAPPFNMRVYIHVSRLRPPVPLTRERKKTELAPWSPW